MIAVNQVLTPKVTQGTVSDEAVADPEIPFSNTLDELLEDSMTEFEAEDLLLGELEEGQLMAEQGLGEEAILVEENILETLTDDENQILLQFPWLLNLFQILRLELKPKMENQSISSQACPDLKSFSRANN